MVTLAVTHNFAPNTLAEADEVDQNFSDIVGWANTNVIQKDALIAFTAIPSGPSSDPSSDNQFARKRYVDRLFQSGFETLTFTAQSARTGTITWPVATVGTPDAVQLTVQCGSNFDLCANMQGTPSTTSVSYRVFQKDGGNITGSARLYWTVFGRF